MSNTRFASAVSLLTLIAATSGWAQDAAPSRTITTNGEAVVYVVPDEISILLGVETFDVALEQARRLNEASGASLLKALAKSGVDSKDIQTDQLQVTIAYNTDLRPRRIEGYVVSRAYSVRVRRPETFQHLVATALASGANQIHGIDYQTTQLRKHRDEARRTAIRAARQKALDLAAELACDVGAARTVHEGYSGFWFGDPRRRGGGIASQNVAFSAQGGGPEGGDATPLGQIGVRAQITATFGLAAQLASGAVSGSTADGVRSPYTRPERAESVSSACGVYHPRRVAGAGHLTAALHGARLCATRSHSLASERSPHARQSPRRGVARGPRVHRVSFHAGSGD